MPNTQPELETNSKILGFETRDYYKILGVEKTATFYEIKDAYNALLKQQNDIILKNTEEKKGTGVAENNKKTLAEAFEVLGDDYKRKLYDDGEDKLENINVYALHMKLEEKVKEHIKSLPKEKAKEDLESSQKGITKVIFDLLQSEKIELAELFCTKRNLWFRDGDTVSKIISEAATIAHAQNASAKAFLNGANSIARFDALDTLLQKKFGIFFSPSMEIHRIKHDCPEDIRKGKITKLQGFEQLKKAIDEAITAANSAEKISGKKATLSQLQKISTELGNKIQHEQRLQQPQPAQPEPIKRAPRETVVLSPEQKAEQEKIARNRVDAMKKSEELIDKFLGIPTEDPNFKKNLTSELSKQNYQTLTVIKDNVHDFRTTPEHKLDNIEPIQQAANAILLQRRELEKPFIEIARKIESDLHSLSDVKWAKVYNGEKVENVSQYKKEAIEGLRKTMDDIHQQILDGKITDKATIAEKLNPSIEKVKQVSHDKQLLSFTTSKVEKVMKGLGEFIDQKLSSAQPSQTHALKSSK